MTEEQELIFDLFHQVCYNEDKGKYFHQFISTFEDAQYYLLEKGIIKKTQCECM
jgi:hypothetical protein